MYTYMYIPSGRVLTISWVSKEPKDRHMCININHNSAFKAHGGSLSGPLMLNKPTLFCFVLFVKLSQKFFKNCVSALATTSPSPTRDDSKILGHYIPFSSSPAFFYRTMKIIKRYPCCLYNNLRIT